eukprot:scaffold64287_cov41-Cyclotella_meneghiniana.AAC.2
MTKRTRLTQNESSKGIECIACSLNIPPSADHVELSPCQCVICPECLLSKVCSHGGSADGMSCGCCCDSIVTSHLYHKARHPSQSIAVHTLPAECSPVVDDKSWMQKPHKDSHDSKQTSHRSSARRQEENESKYSLSKCIVPLTRIAGNDTIDCDWLEGLKDFGTFLHVDVTQQSRMTYDSMESLSPVMYVEKKVNALTPLTALLYGLATGTSEIDKDTICKPYLDD